MENFEQTNRIKALILQRALGLPIMIRNHLAYSLGDLPLLPKNLRRSFFGTEV